MNVRIKAKNMQRRDRKNDEETFARNSKVVISGKEFETPTFWLGQQAHGTPEPWKEFNVNNLFVNAYEILNNGSAEEKARNLGVHDWLEHKGAVMMDSGGFLFQKKDEMTADPMEILDFYKDSQPDLGVILDHPLDPSQELEENRKRWKKTVENFKEMQKRSPEDLNLMPVVHGYTPGDIEKSCELIKEELGESPDFIGLGSLVPLMKPSVDLQNFYQNLSDCEYQMTLEGGFLKPTKYQETLDNEKIVSEKSEYNAVHFVVDAIMKVREEFPDSFMHVFGIGGATTMHLMFSLGVDSIDTVGWRLKAAHGAIQLPGTGDRTINGGQGRLGVMGREEEERKLANCECPSCKGKSLEERAKDLDDNYSSRAIHNAYVFQKEQEAARKAIKEGRYQEFTEDRLFGSPYKKFFKYAQKKDINIEG